MSDPMRPPGAQASPDAASVTPGGGLQAVLLSSQRKVAVIDGTPVPLGGRIGGATLTGMSDSSAVLKKKNDSDVLLMHPNVEKKPAVRRELP